MEAVSLSTTKILTLDGSRTKHSNYQDECAAFVRARETRPSDTGLSNTKSSLSSDTAGPHFSGEEERQLQLAIELSKQEAEQREQGIRDDELTTANGIISIQTKPKHF